MFATPPSPSPSVSPSSTLPPQLPHIPPFTSSDTFRDMSLEHHLLSLTLGDVPPPTMSYPSQPIHPFDHPDALQNRCKSNGKDTPTTPHNNSVYPCHPVHAKTIKKSKNGALSALSRRFAPGLPSRSLSSPATATLASLAAAGSDPKSGSGSSSGASSSSAFGAHRSADELSCPPSRPLTGCSQERGRHHSISGAPSQDSRRPRSACASSCSSSSTSSASTTSTSSTPSSSSSSSPPCPATSSSPPPPPPPFFSSSTLYTLFGSSASTPSYLHTPTDPSIATTSLPATPSPLGPPSGTTIHKMTTTRQTRSASCTSFSLPSLFIPKDTPNARANHHSSNPLSPTVRSSDTRPPLSLGSLARLNAQQQEIQPVHPQPLQPIFHRSNPVSPSAAYQQTKFPITSPTTSPTSLPPLPVFHSLSSLTFSASDLGSPDTLSPVSAHAKDQCHSSIMMGTTPLSSTESLCEIGGMAAVAGSPVDVSCSVRSQVYAQHHPYARAHSHPQVHLYGQIPIHAHHATHAAASQASFEAGSTRLEWSLSGRSSSSTSVNSIGRSSLMPPASPESSTFSSDSNCLGGSRRSSKDSSLDSAPGVTLNDLVDQLTIPDYVNTVEQITKTKVFLMIYRKFLRPRELLEMFIDRFEDVGKTTDDDDEEARNTRLRICACLHYWFRHHPNDLIHWQTRQRVVTFLKERVAAFPSLSEIYMKLLPLSSVRYFNSWRWPQQYQHGPESDGSLPAGSAMEDFESGIYNVSGAPSEHMDEDRDWGLYDEDEVLSESKKSMSMENLSPFRPVINAPGLRVNTGKSVSGMCRQGRTTPRAIPAQMSRDRRSSTGSLAHSSACAMEAVVAGRRGSASSVTSGTTHSSPLNPSYVPPSNHSEGDLTPQQQQPQSAISIPFMAKRNGIRHRGASPGGPLHPLHPLHPGGGNATIMSKETSEETTMHPLLGGRVNSLPPSVDYLSMNTPFIDIKDAAIAAQLTCVEFGLFKKLKVRKVVSDKRQPSAYQTRWLTMTTIPKQMTM
ncbi:hypothetical protein B0O80DRAFT_221594 [Mortierella sp. GBAus27b]|nr:hypothetical protein B0O80DRAFT_221594 [Mortierella sp. GBAus27b]